MCKGLIYLTSFVLLSGLMSANAAIPEALWEFEEDLTAAYNTEYNGIEHGSIEFVCGQVGRAARFDGGYDYEVVVDYVESDKTTPAADFDGGFSVMGWVNPDEVQYGGPMILSHDRTTNYQTMGFGVSVQTDGRLGLGMKDKSDNRMSGGCAAGLVPAGEWTHFAVTWNGNHDGGIQVYVNGEPQQTSITHQGEFTGLNSTGPLPFRIAADHPNSAGRYNGLAGSIDQLSIWKVVLTASEIHDDYEAGLKTPVDLLEALALIVIDMNLQNGIENSLDAKLDAALNALDDTIENNDVAAVNTLGAFMNAVEAQRGNKLTDEQANILIADAQYIIDVLTGVAEQCPE